MKSKKLTTPSIRTSTSRPFLRRGSLPSALVLAVVLFALSSTVRAVTPAPDGGYPGNNTAEGDNALFSLTGGTNCRIVGTPCEAKERIVTLSGVVAGIASVRCWGHRADSRRKCKQYHGKDERAGKRTAPQKWAASRSFFGWGFQFFRFHFFVFV